MVLPPAAAAYYIHQALFCHRLRSVSSIPRVNFIFLFFPLGDASLNRSGRYGKYLVSNGAIHAKNPTKNALNYAQKPPFTQ